MIMKKNKLLHYDLDIYEEVLDNGLSIYVIPFQNINNIYATFSTKYGSIHDEFIPIDSEDYYKVPMGVAHFLEHKVFETNDGIEPFNYFSSHGADCNANTSNYKTTYLFSGPTDFEENINFLLDFVQSPYFTDENVEKEKGIIEQELKMLNDRPYWHLYEKTLNNVFSEHPIKYPVGGTIESVRSIMKEDLYKCYNTFYHPANMFVTITGNVDPGSVIEIIKNNQANKSFAPFKDIILKKYNEPDTVVKEKEKIDFDVNIPKVCIGYKINKLDYDINRLRLYLNIYFSNIIGCTSVLDEELRDNNLISEDLDFDVVNTDNHLLYMVNFESNNYNEVIDKIINTVGKVKITKEELNRKIKGLKSGIIFRSDNIYSLNSKVNNNLIDYNKIIYDEYELIESLSIDELNDILEKISFNNKSIIILESK